MNEQIELITNYFPPEMGAAAGRMYNLAKGLDALGYDVEVIAPIPNYPEGEIFDGYQNKFKIVEAIDQIKVQRFWIYPSFSKKSILRFFGMLTFPVTLWAGLFHLFKRKPDVVIVQNTPLLVSFSAMILAKLLPNCKRILNVSDLWPLTAAETGLIKKKSLKYTFMEWLEQSNYKKADLIAGQSNEILQYIRKRVDKPFFLYRNISPSHHIRKADFNKYHEGNLKIIYAGLLSSVQGIYALCRAVDFQKTGVEFHIYGSGEEEAQIQAYIQAQSDTNIQFHERVSREELHQILPGYHASVVPLAKSIYGAVPSKIYESVAFNVPVLFCGGGEGAEIIEKHKLGYISKPGDYESLKKNILHLKTLPGEAYKNLLSNCTEFTRKNLNFKNQLEHLMNEVKNLSD